MPDFAPDGRLRHILSTERLVMRPLVQQDHQRLHDIFIHPLVRFYLWDDRIISEEETLEIIVKSEQQFKEIGCGLWMLFVRPEPDSRQNRQDPGGHDQISPWPALEAHPAGFAGFWHFFSEHELQVLYGLHPDYQGHGYAVEALRRLLSYGIEELDMVQITGSTDSANQASARVMQKAGMTKLAERSIDGKPFEVYRYHRASFA